MLDLEQIITLLYPSASSEQKKEVLERCKKSGIDYDVKSWLEVEYQQLSSEKVKDNLVLTFFYNQESYFGVIGEILHTLNVFSGGVVQFKDLDLDTNEFYERYFGVVGFTHFAFLAPSIQIQLLGGRFLLLTALWGVPILSKVQGYFARFCSLDILKRDARWFANAIKNNKTPILNDRALSDFLGEEDREINTVTDPIIKPALELIAKLYRLLQTGGIWQNLDYSLCSHAKSEDKENVNIEELYLHRLQETTDLSSWVEDYKDIAKWCEGRSVNLVKKILLEIKNKLPLNQFEEPIINLINELSGVGFPEIIDAIIFNESTGQFEWNSDLLS